MELRFILHTTAVTLYSIGVTAFIDLIVGGAVDWPFCQDHGYGL